MFDAPFAPVKIVVVYHSGYDHAARLAEAVAPVARRQSVGRASGLSPRRKRPANGA